MVTADSRKKEIDIKMSVPFLLLINKRTTLLSCNLFLSKIRNSYCKKCLIMIEFGK